MHASRISSSGRYSRTIRKVFAAEEKSNWGQKNTVKPLFLRPNTIKISPKRPQTPKGRIISEWGRLLGTQECPKCLDLSMSFLIIISAQARGQLNWIGGGGTDVEVKVKAGERLKVQHLYQKERSICQDGVCP